MNRPKVIVEVDENLFCPIGGNSVENCRFFEKVNRNTLLPLYESNLEIFPINYPYKLFVEDCFLYRDIVGYCLN